MKKETKKQEPKKSESKKSENSISRREFLTRSAAGIAGLTILPSWVMGGVRIAPSDRVVMGFIGLGQQGCSDMSSFTACPGVQIAACCDVDSIKRERFRRRVTAWQKSINMAERCDVYEFYEDLLDRKDIDAVAIATPDHWHALVAIHACQSGKDVFCQKPLAYTITEGLAVQTAARLHKRVFQMGSQQRSSAEFQKAIELVQSGAIGHIDKIYARVGDPPKPLDLPEMPIPANLNFNQWLGPLNDPKIHYHPDLCPPISLDPEKNETLWGAWRWYQETGNGYPADWGAHMFDIGQWAIGKDGSGPVEILPPSCSPYECLTYRYDNGIEMTQQQFDGGKQGIKIYGENGWIQVCRGEFLASSPEFMPSDVDKKAMYETNVPHYQSFIDGVRTRRDPNVPVEIGHSSCTVCNLGNIAYELNRPLQWNPIVQKFMNDPEAEKHMHYEYRKPYTLG